MEGPDFGMEDQEGIKKESSWEVIREWFRMQRTVPLGNNFSSSSMSLYGPNMSPAKMQDLRLLLGVLGCPLAPIPISTNPMFSLHIRDIPLVSRNQNPLFLFHFLFGSGIFTSTESPVSLSFLIWFRHFPYTPLLFLNSAGDVDGVLYYPAVFGGDGVLEAAEVREEHVRIGNGEIDTVRNRGFDGEKREDDGVQEWGEWLLRFVADVAGNVVP